MDQAVTHNGLPVQQGLYDPRNEHDACGIGFVVNINGEPSHDIITKGIQSSSTSRIAAPAAAIRRPATARAF